MLANLFDGGVSSGLWLDFDAKVLRRVQFHRKFDYLGQPTELQLTVDYTELNGLGDFPEAA